MWKALKRVDMVWKQKKCIQTQVVLDLIQLRINEGEVK